MCVLIAIDRVMVYGLCIVVARCCVCSRLRFRRMSLCVVCELLRDVV